jgi:hypothetical protein
MAAATERRPPFPLNAISNRLGLFDEGEILELWYERRRVPWLKAICPFARGFTVLAQILTMRALHRSSPSPQPPFLLLPSL